MLSLASMNGPSVTTGSALPDDWWRTVVALLGMSSWSAYLILSWCFWNQAPTWAYRSRSWSGESAAKAAASASLPQNRRTYFMGRVTSLHPRGRTANAHFRQATHAERTTLPN